MEAKRDFRIICGGHHVQGRQQIYVLQESSFSIALKFVDVVIRTDTTEDVLQESEMYDLWNVDGDRNMSGSFTSITQFTFFETTPPQKY